MKPSAHIKACPTFVGLLLPDTFLKLLLIPHPKGRSDNALQQAFCYPFLYSLDPVSPATATNIYLRFVQKLSPLPLGHYLILRSSPGYVPENAS